MRKRKVMDKRVSNVYEFYKMYQIAKPTEREEILIEIVYKLTPLIKKIISPISTIYYDDCKQDLIIKIYEIYEKGKFKVSLFEKMSILRCDMLSEENLELMSESEKKWLLSFTTKNDYYKELYNRAQLNSLSFQLFLKEFCNFIGEKQLLNYLYVVLINHMKRLSAKYKTHLSLNKKNEQGYELIELLLEKSKPIKRINNKNLLLLLSEKDREFMKLFFPENGDILTQEEVALLLNVSQQAISNRQKRILGKIHEME